jgi:aminobenzoyl-glutamate transport protein
VIIFARRYVPGYGVGNLLSLMLPYSMSFLLSGVLLLALWIALDLPLGPGVGSVHYPR